MDTPICDFINEYNRKSPLRLHMPGHKGECFVGGEKNDITEIVGADVLYSSSGIIRRSEENASRLFGTQRTVYSAEGSSLSIRAMLFMLKLFCEQRGEKPFVLAARNSHKVFISAAALLDIEVSWIFPQSESYISCDISPLRLEKEINNLPKKPSALYLTSPDYLGNIADIGGISAVCRRHNILLLVDNAHGAYLGFLPQSRHPIHLGADMCCDSAHKTLPVLTGGGYLHIAKGAPKFFSENCEKVMSVFASTSPSYLILQSLDKANAYLSDRFPNELEAFTKRAARLKEELTACGYELAGDEELKLTIKTKPYGYTGQELSAVLEKENIFCEFCDSDFLVMMLTPQVTAEELQRLKEVFLKLERKAPIETVPPVMTVPKQKMSANKALFSPSQSVSIENSKGRILASPSVSCPPAIPIVSLGEEIDESALEVLRYYGVESVEVVATEARSPRH